MVSPCKNALIADILESARTQHGWDQTELARRAGMATATLSRAKQRHNIDSKTLEALARAAGLRLTLEPEAHAPVPLRRTRLAEPGFGLAWSNRNAPDDVLIRQALLRGSYPLILQAVLDAGLDTVRREWAWLLANEGDRIPQQAREDVARQLRNMETGLSRAAA